MRRIQALLFSIALLSSSCRAMAAVYYVGKNGDDANDGTTAASAWATIARVNATQFAAGDSILFQGGETFAGSLSFDSGDRGTAAKPIIVSSYGDGRATISSGGEKGLIASNTAGFEISKLNFVGSGRTNNAITGVYFFVDQPNAKLEHVVCDQLEISGYGENGLAFGGWEASNPGFTNVRITNVVAHDNAKGGIVSYGFTHPTAKNWSHRNFYVAHCLVYGNTGIPTADYQTGNGIWLSNVDGAVIEYCEARHNGTLNASKTGGPVGIWSDSSNNVVVQYCESHHNSAGTGRFDGGGFDCDGGDTNCVIQYCYSHDNDGAGFLVGDYPGSAPTADNIVRYNISENDARRNNASIDCYAGSGCLCYNNTIFLGSSSEGTPKGIYVTGTAVGTKVFNNIVQATGGVELVHIDVDTIMSGNCYFASGDAFKMLWKGATYSSLAEFKRSTGQEAAGLQVDPKLAGVGAGVTVGDPAKLTEFAGYRLLDSSPLIGDGLALSQQFGIDPGKRDFFGNALPLGKAFDIGAHERR